MNGGASAGVAVTQLGSKSAQIKMQQVVGKNEIKDKHFEAISTKATLISINRSRAQRKVKNMETELNKNNIDLDKLKELCWSGIPKSKQQRLCQNEITNLICLLQWCLNTELKPGVYSATTSQQTRS